MIRMAQLVIVIFVSLGLVSGAAAQAAGKSPVGAWEASVSGTANGVSFTGTAYIEFLDDGSCSGIALVKKSDEQFVLSGSWSLSANKKVYGALTVSSNSYTMVLDMSGSASTGRSLSIRATGDGSDRFKLSGKPTVSMPDLSGRYQGLIRMRGVNRLLTLDLATPDPEMPSVYPISGEMFSLASGTDSLSGFAIVKANGDFIAFILNDSTGYSASVWGKFRTRGTIGASGIDLSDGSSIRVKFFDTPFTS